MPLLIPTKESNDIESYRRLERVSIETFRYPKADANLGKLTSFQYASGIPGIAYNPFVDKEGREA